MRAMDGGTIQTVRGAMRDGKSRGLRSTRGDGACNSIEKVAPHPTTHEPFAMADAPWGHDAKHHGGKGLIGEILLDWACMYVAYLQYSRCDLRVVAG